jgi:site-specific recombinase XerD
VYLQEFINDSLAKGYSGLYRCYIPLYLQYCSKNNINPLEANYATINKYVLFLKEQKLTEGTINNYIKTIRSYYKFLTNCLQVMKAESLENINKYKLLKEPKVLRDYLTAEEINKLIANGMTVIKTIDAIKLKAIIYFMFYTGLRASEICNLKRADFDLDNLKAKVRIPVKNKNERFAFYPYKIGVLLRNYFESEPEEYNAFNITISKLQRLISKLNLILVKSKKFTPHTFRHSFAHLLAEKDIGVRVAQKLLGHKSLASTLIYYDPDIKIVERVYRENIESKKSKGVSDGMAENV